VRVFLTNAALYVAAAGAQRVVGLLVLAWLATRLTVEEYGKFGLLWAAQQFITLLVLGGLVETVIGWISNADERSTRDTFAVARSGFLLTSGVVTIVGAVAIIVFLPRASDRLEAAAVLVGGIALAYSTLVATFARLEERHVASNVLATLPPLAAFIGGCAVSVATDSAGGFFLGSAVACLVAVGAVRMVAGSVPHTGRLSLESTKRLLIASVPLTGAALFGWLSGYGNNVLIDRFFSAREIGRYTMALSIAAAVHLIAAALNSVWAPRFYRLFGKMAAPSLEALNRAFYNLLAALLGGLGGCLIVLIPIIAEQIGGNLSAYADLGGNLVALVAGYVVLTAWWQTSNHLLAHGAGSIILKVTVVTGVIGTVCWVALMILFGPAGIYAGFVVMMALRAITLGIAARRLVAIQWPWEGVAIGSLLAGTSWFVSTRVDAASLQVLVYLAVLLVTTAYIAKRHASRFLAEW
jgi:O-antigen/teichoic acid export membrane protein